MANIFISHSKKDVNLVLLMSKVLENIGHNPIIEEFISEDEKEKVPYAQIRKNVELSDYVFLFLTDNIVATEYTQNWVGFEVGLAASNRKRLFVFERAGVPVPYPIPYLTDYMIFNEDSTGDILNIQTLAKKINEISKEDLYTGIGGAVGAPFGPLGLVVGGLLGRSIGSSLSEKVLRPQCQNCKVSFNYYSTQFSDFRCPACRVDLTLNLSGDEDG